MHEVYRLEQVSKKTKQHQCPITNINICVFSGQTCGILVKDNYHLEMLYKLMIGELNADSGYYYVDDLVVNEPSFVSLRKRGVYAINRQSQLVTHLNIAENIISIAPSTLSPFFQSPKKNEKDITKIFERFGLSLSPKSYIYELSVSQRHIIEILKGVYQKAKVFIIDDIFYDYSSMDFLFLSEFLNKLNTFGYTVLFFTRIWDYDFFRFTDVLSVVQDGTTMLQISAKDFQKYHSLLSFEDSSNCSYFETSASKNRPVLEFRHINTYRGFQNVSFTVNQQEILGIYDSNCQVIDLMNELLTGQANITGIIKTTNKTSILNKQKYKSSEIGFIPSRASKYYSYFSEMSIMDNVTLMMPKSLFHCLGIFNQRIRKYIFQDIMTSLRCYDILEMDYNSIHNRLAYKNPYIQFKALIARHICAGCHILFIENPQGLYDSSNITELIDLLKVVLNLNISIVLLSPSFNILNQICSRIITTESWIQETELYNPC